MSTSCGGCITKASIEPGGDDPKYEGVIYRSVYPATSRWWDKTIWAEYFKIYVSPARMYKFWHCDCAFVHKVVIFYIHAVIQKWAFDSIFCSAKDQTGGDICVPVSLNQLYARIKLSILVYRLIWCIKITIAIVFNWGQSVKANMQRV